MGETFWNRRFLIESAVALALAVGAFLLGMALAPTVIASMAEAGGSAALVMTSPSDVLVARWKLGVALAWPAVVGWIAVVIHRARARRAPGIFALAIDFAVPFAAAAVGIALSSAALASATGHEGGLEIEPMLAVRDLLPGLYTYRVVHLAALVLWVAVFFVARARGAGTMR